jgi:hypothetical protein
LQPGNESRTPSLKFLVLITESARCFLSPLRGSVQFLQRLFLGLTPQAHHLSPLRGSNSATEDRSVSHQFDRRPKRAPKLFSIESPDAGDGAPEARQIFCLGRQPAGGSETWPRLGIAGRRPLAGDGASRRPKAVRNPRYQEINQRMSPGGATDCGCSVSCGHRPRLFCLRL